MIALPYAQVSTMLRQAVPTQYSSVTDRRTDRTAMSISVHAANARLFPPPCKRQQRQTFIESFVNCSDALTRERDLLYWSVEGTWN